MIHELKCLQGPFQEKWNCNKSWEFRKNDRVFKHGDILQEREYDSATGLYSGREIREEVTYILFGPEFGIPEGYCIMSTKEVSRTSVDNDVVLKKFGWSIDCQSPFDISHIDGSYATGQGAYIILEALKEQFNLIQNHNFNE